MYSKFRLSSRPGLQIAVLALLTAAASQPATTRAAAPVESVAKADSTHYVSGASDSTDFRLAPSDAALASRADSIRARRRNGAIALFGSLALASVIIGAVRARQRRNKNP
jgi:hypothetical protein